MADKEIGDLALLRVMVEELGYRAAMATLGWCVAAVVMAGGTTPTRDWLLDHGPGERTGRYSKLRDLRRVRLAVERSGYTMGPEADEGAVVARVAREGVVNG